MTAGEQEPRKIRVLIADDSMAYRSQIRAALASFDNVEVAGAASNGRIACDFLQQSKIDLLILDLEMPEMDGLQTLKEMKVRGLTETKVLLFSSFSRRGLAITLDALKAGASDFMVKIDPQSALEIQSGQKRPSDLIRDLFAPKLRALFPQDVAFAEPHRSVSLDSPETSVERRSGLSANLPATQLMRRPRRDWDSFAPSVLVIGSSTGGPTALEEIFSKLHAPFRIPVVIVQHMPPVFTATLAERLSKLCGVEAREAVDGEALSSNRIYVAPGDYHVAINGTRMHATLSVTQSPHENFVRPAVDPLFRSAARVFASDTLAVVLTGMGSDGKQGAIEIDEAGGMMLIQSKESCVVFGMPAAIFESGAYDKMGTPTEIAELLNQKLASPSTTQTKVG